MDVLLATDITPAMLVSTTAPERLEGQEEWEQKAYPVGSVVTRSSARRVYRAVYAVPATTRAPDIDSQQSQIPYWLDIGPMNQWAMFDGQVGTVTRSEGELVVTLRPGAVSSIWLGNISNATTARVVVTDEPGGNVVYDETLALSKPVSSWWDYWFAPFAFAADATFAGIPAYRRSEVTVTLTGSGVGVGMLAAGIVENLGRTQWGPETDYRNYSAKSLDQTWGPSEGTDGVVTRDQTYTVYVHPDDAPRVSRFMDTAMRRPAVWVPTGDSRFEGIRVFGQAADATLSYPSPNVVLLSLNIRGFI